MIRDETVPPEAETPGFVLSMNADHTAFPDEIMKSALMIYTTTALPPHDEVRRMMLQGEVRRIRHRLTTALHCRYLSVMQTRWAGQDLPPDWLTLSSQVLCNLFAVSGQELPG